MKMEQSVPKRQHIKFRRRGITQKKTYNKVLYVAYKFKMFLNECEAVVSWTQDMLYTSMVLKRGKSDNVNTVLPKMCHVW